MPKRNSTAPITEHRKSLGKRENYSLKKYGALPPTPIALNPQPEYNLKTALGRLYLFLHLQHALGLDGEMSKIHSHIKPLKDSEVLEKYKSQTVYHESESRSTESQACKSINHTQALDRIDNISLNNEYLEKEIFTTNLKHDQQPAFVPDNMETAGFSSNTARSASASNHPLLPTAFVAPAITVPWTRRPGLLTAAAFGITSITSTLAYFGYKLHQSYSHNESGSNITLPLWEDFVKSANNEIKLLIKDSLPPSLLNDIEVSASTRRKRNVKTEFRYPFSATEVLDKLNLSATDREKLEKFLTYILEGYEKELGEQKIVYIEQAGLKAFGGMMTFLDGKLSPDNRMFSNAYWTLLTESEIYSSVVNQVQRPPDSLEMDEGDILLKLADMTLSIQSSLDSLSGPSIDEIIKEKCNEHYQHGNCPNLDDQFEVEVKTLVSADRASHYITDTKTFTARDIFLGKHLRYALRNHAITKITDNILRTKSAPITESIDLELKSIISKLKGNNEFKNIYITTLEDRVKAIVANNIGMDPNRPISVDLFLSGRLHPRLVICNEKIVPELVVLSHPTGLHDVYVSLKNSEVKQYPEYPTDASFEKFIRQHLSVFENAAIKPRELISYKYQLPPAYLDIHKWYKPVTSRNSKTYSNELYSTHLDKLASDLDSTVYTQAEGMRDTLLNLLRDVLMGASIVTGIATMGVSSGLGFLVLAGTSTAFAVGEVFTNKMIASETDDGAVHRAATEQAQLGIILTAVGASVDLLAIGKIVKNTVTNFKQYQAVVSTFELGSTIDKGYRSASNLISEGSIGRVYNYGNGFLIKDYNGIIKPHLTGRLVKANNNAKAMNRLYGPGSANVILDADIVNTGVKTVSVKMRRVPGESLDSILKGNEEALINEVKKQMTPDAINEIVDKLKYNGIDYNDINLGNILYDSKSKKFNIIDFDDAEILAEGVRVNDPKAETMRTKFEHNFNDFKRTPINNLKPNANSVSSILGKDSALYHDDTVRGTLHIQAHGFPFNVNHLRTSELAAGIRTLVPNTGMSFVRTEGKIQVQSIELYSCYGAAFGRYSTGQVLADTLQVPVRAYRRKIGPASRDRGIVFQPRAPESHMAHHNKRINEILFNASEMVLAMRRIARVRRQTEPDTAATKMQAFLRDVVDVFEGKNNDDIGKRYIEIPAQSFAKLKNAGMNFAKKEEENAQPLPPEDFVFAVMSIIWSDKPLHNRLLNLARNSRILKPAKEGLNK